MEMPMNITDIPAALISTAVFLLGAAIGSFLNVCIYRLPLGRSIVTPGSACPACGHRIRWFENIPILSFLLLRARCSACNQPISLRYPFVELVMGILAVFLWQKFPFQVDFFIYLTFCAAMVIITFIDLDHMIIPDIISLPGIAIGFAASFISNSMDWQQSLMGILLGGGLFYAVAFIFCLVTKREGLGGGDIKLLAMIGAFLGWQAIAFVIFLSAFVGAVVGLIYTRLYSKGENAQIPYGPFLAGAAICYLFYGQIIIMWYMNLFML